MAIVCCSRRYFRLRKMNWKRAMCAKSLCTFVHEPSMLEWLVPSWRSFAWPWQKKWSNKELFGGDRSPVSSVARTFVCFVCLLLLSTRKVAYGLWFQWKLCPKSWHDYVKALWTSKRFYTVFFGLTCVRCALVCILWWKWMGLDNQNCQAQTLLTLEVLYLYCSLWALTFSTYC